MDEIIGKKFGRWTVIGNYRKIGYRKEYLCKCSCEKQTVKYVNYQCLKRGQSQSCGCLAVELTRQRMTTHGGSHSRLFGIWCDMKVRCNNPNDKCYDRYGGRGIKVCDEWQKDFKSFRDWSYSNGYKDNLKWTECSLDRIDNNKGYSPDNCRWVDSYVQGNNKRNNIIIELNGEKKTAAEWGRELGIRPATIRARYRRGQFDNILGKNNHDVFLTLNGESHTMAEWSRITGINIQTISERNKKGWPVERVLSTKGLKRKI